ncbi:MAG: hypothetical protein MR645_00330 [Paraprevotella sp.]|nr:hypothetical protein [Paraprevotella sp.]
MDCHPRTLVGIAKRPNTRTDRQPTYMSCSVPRVSFGEIGDFTRSEALPFISN